MREVLAEHTFRSRNCLNVCTQELRAIRSQMTHLHETMQGVVNLLLAIQTSFAAATGSVA